MPTALFGGCTAGISEVGVARKLFGQKYLTRKINFVAKNGKVPGKWRTFRPFQFRFRSIHGPFVVRFTMDE